MFFFLSSSASLSLSLFCYLIQLVNKTKFIQFIHSRAYSRDRRCIYTSTMREFSTILLYGCTSFSFSLFFLSFYSLLFYFFFFSFSALVCSSTLTTHTDRHKHKHSPPTERTPTTITEAKIIIWFLLSLFLFFFSLLLLLLLFISQSGDGNSTHSLSSLYVAARSTTICWDWLTFF